MLLEHCTYIASEAKKEREGKVSTHGRMCDRKHLVLWRQKRTDYSNRLLYVHRIKFGNKLALSLDLAGFPNFLFLITELSIQALPLENVISKIEKSSYYILSQEREKKIEKPADINCRHCI